MQGLGEVIGRKPYLPPFVFFGEADSLKSYQKKEKIKYKRDFGRIGRVK